MWAVLFYYYGNFKGNPVLTNCPSFKKKKKRVTSLVVQLSRIRAPMQRPWVQSLIWEDFTGQAANKLACLEPMLDEERSYYHDKPTHSN